LTVPRHRSRTVKRKYITTPGHISVISYKKPNPNVPRCGITKDKLNGVPRIRAGKYGKISKSKIRPNRKYGGNYSPRAVKNALERAIWMS